ncbi:glycosyltransferase family 4 protein [Salinibacter ruber]|uniref:glycosyltransferase family 4 protein n=1 Tax=Salinibacter ruber TaxID=146919 RepID=UPI00160C4740|nr:glycosyltransferase family 4 protein [Salinibacter ruber]MBB4091152.1 glycosyltransferase involved in cell wall biosynthesis [Salinibacter ruber]
MRIAYLSDSIIPSRAANSVHVMKMCQAFAQHGHDVLLIAESSVGEELSSAANPFDFYGVNETFGLRLVEKPNVKGSAYVYALQAAHNAWQFSADVAYGRDIYSCFFAQMMGFPVVFEAHCIPQRAGYKTQWIHRRLLNSQRLKQLVVISESLKEDYCRNYDIPASRVLVAHDAADDPDSMQENPLPERESLSVGYVGHLYTGKGMKIMARLIEEYTNIYFHIIGGNEEDIEHWKNRLDTENNVLFHGYVPHSKTDKYRQACDVLIAPYQKEAVGSGGMNIASWMSPLKIFEYMAAGKPIVSSDLPVLREVLTHGENAWLCAPEEPAEWVEALAHLRDHPEIRKQLGEQARREFKEKYTWVARAEKVLRRI